MMVCAHCKFPIEEKLIGCGDDTVQKFAHPECYYRKRSEGLETAIKIVLQNIEGNQDCDKVLRQALWASGRAL